MHQRRSDYDLISSRKCNRPWFHCRSHGIVPPPRRGRHEMGTKPNGGDRPPTSSCRILVLGGSKGGCGRSTLCKNLLVLAGQAGIRAIGIDFDAQRTLAKWSKRRAAAREKLPEVVPVEVIEGQVDQWPSVVRQINGYQLAVIDTAPG